MSVRLSAEHVVAGYGGLDILHGVSFVVEPGTITTVVGPNGSGKSTIFRAVYGLISPRQGSIRIDGHEVSRDDTARRISLGVAMVPQLPSVFPEMTVLENLDMGAYSLGGRKRRRTRVHEVLEKFPILRERTAQKAGTMSGGERRTLEIARALLLEPRLLLLDEPSVGLSPNLVEALFRQVAELRDELGLTILMVEQNARTALRISDVGIVVQEGLVSHVDDGATLLADPAIGLAFIGVSDSNRVAQTP